MWKMFNPNPLASRVGDCAVRAVCKAIGADWENAYLQLVCAGMDMCDMPSSNNVWGAILRKNGFERFMIPNSCPDCYSVADFCRDYPKGLYVLTLKNHVVAVEDGDIYDTWDCSGEIPLYFWKRKGD